MGVFDNLRKGRAKEKSSGTASNLRKGRAVRYLSGVADNLRKGRAPEILRISGVSQASQIQIRPVGNASTPDSSDLYFALPFRRL